MKQKLLNLAANTVKYRKRGENGKTDRKQRHNGNQRSVGQRRSNPENGVVLGALCQKKQEIGYRPKLFRQFDFPFHEFTFA